MAKIRFDDTDDIIDIRYDNVFKAVFTRNTPESQKALSRLISSLIEREITVTAITANEPPIDSLSDRQIRFDIACKTEDDEPINIEMSLNPDSFEPVRLEYHAAKLFSGQEIRGSGKSYNDLKYSYQIAILANKNTFPDEIAFHTFENYDRVNHIPLGGRSRIVTMELSKLGGVIKQPMKGMSEREHWALFFQYSTDKAQREKINEILELEEGIAMASQVLKTISKDEIERARLTSELKYQLDTQSHMVNARREGLQEGLREGQSEIARNLMAMGLSMEQIAQGTGLSVEQIAKL